MAKVELTEDRVVVDGCELHGCVARYDVTVEPNRLPVVTLSLTPPAASIKMDDADVFANVGLWPDSVQRAVYYALKEKFGV